jgi:putative transposase
MGLPPLLIQVDAGERDELERLLRRHSTSQALAQRISIVLLADEGLNNGEIARKLGISIKMARTWRRRWKETEGKKFPSVLDRVGDLPRPGKPMKFTLDQQVEILAMACRTPSNYGLPDSQWSIRSLRDKAVEEGVVESISLRQVGRWLNEADLKPHQCQYWLFPPSGSTVRGEKH